MSKEIKKLRISSYAKRINKSPTGVFVAINNKLLNTEVIDNTTFVLLDSKSEEFERPKPRKQYTRKKGVLPTKTK